MVTVRKGEKSGIKIQKKNWACAIICELVFSYMFLIKCSICFYFHVIVINCLPLITKWEEG